MKKLLALTFLLTLNFSMNSQVITLSPEKPAFNKEVTLTFYADKGNRGLEDFDGNIYAHTGLITNESSHAGDWKKVVADWGDNKDILKLKKVKPNVWQLKFNISELYQIPITGGNLVALAYVFRSADGSKIGKEKGNSDIFHYFKKPNFKAPPTTLTESETPHPDWAKYASLYEVNIRQYTPEGTINAFAEHLPRLREMGIDVLWIMPVQPIGEVKRKGKLGSYYSIKDFKGVHPDYGTFDDFKMMVKKAHGLGIKVVLDWVANHSAWDNVWAEAHPDWYTRDEDGNRVAPYDWTDVADLDYTEYYLRQAMTDAMVFWVREGDIDGFRCDVAGEVPVDFWEDTREKLNKEKEVWMLAEDEGQTWLLNRAFNANYGWGLHHSLNEIAKGHTSAEKIFEHVEKAQNDYPEGTYTMNFITNHDENSWAGTIDERMGDGHKAFATLIFCLPGIPLMYSGQEANNKKRLEFFDKDPIDWSDKSLIPFYTKLNELKAENPALWNGNAGGILKKIETSNPSKVIAFSREKEGNKVVSIFNLSGDSQEVSISVDSDFGGYEDYFSGKKVNLDKHSKMNLEAWETRVLIFKEAAVEMRH